MAHFMGATSASKAVAAPKLARTTLVKRHHPWPCPLGAAPTKATKGPRTRADAAGRRNRQTGGRQQGSLAAAAAALALSFIVTDFLLWGPRLCPNPQSHLGVPRVEEILS